MRTLSPVILSSDLRAADVPPLFKNWTAIANFAATFSPRCELKEGAHHAGVSAISAAATVTEIRAALYHEYRHYNHLGHEPAEEVKQQCLQAVTALRGKVR